MPTLWPERERERASWVVTEDLPTPPLLERTCVILVWFIYRDIEVVGRTRRMFDTLLRDMVRVVVLLEAARRMCSLYA